MIRNRLKEILAIKNITASKVFEGTGIAKSTLSAITNNETDRIKLETINKLCIYLEITPGEFFEFYPADVAFIKNEIKYIKKSDHYSIKTTIRLDEKNASYFLVLTGILDWRFEINRNGKRVQNTDQTLLSGSLFLDKETKENEAFLKNLKDYPVGIIEKFKGLLDLQVASDLLTEKKRTWSDGRVVFEYKK